MIANGFCDGMGILMQPYRDDQTMVLKLYPIMSGFGEDAAKQQMKGKAFAGAAKKVENH
jgi:hypothetical protein